MGKSSQNREPLQLVIQILEETAEKFRLQLVIQILEETAEKFRSLDDESKISLIKNDAQTSNQKLIEKGQLLVDLSDQLENTLKNIDPQLKNKIMKKAQEFAAEAQKWMKEKNFYGLDVLLTNKDDKNDLEKLIDLVKNESKN